VTILGFGVGFGVGLPEATGDAEPDGAGDGESEALGEGDGDGDAARERRSALPAAEVADDFALGDGDGPGVVSAMVTEKPPIVGSGISLKSAFIETAPSRARCRLCVPPF
jgi:hypothetical protein